MCLEYTERLSLSSAGVVHIPSVGRKKRPDMYLFYIFGNNQSYICIATRSSCSREGVFGGDYSRVNLN